MIYLDRGDEARAVSEFERELATEAQGHLYSRECCANTWYAIGSLELWKGRIEEARAAFERAIDRVAIHPMARVGLEAVRARARGAHDASAVSMSSDDPPRTSIIDTAMCEAAHILLERGQRRSDGPNDPRRAADVIETALAGAPAASAGWLIPLDPLLRVRAAPDAWASVLVRLRARAA